MSTLLLTAPPPLSSPFRSHIRQLLYIALYPPSPTTNPKTSQESPTKLSSRHAYSSLFPSPTASELAKRTLRVLADINSPTSLLRALPAYRDPNDADGGPPDFDPELPSDVDSFVASEAIRLKNCKNCWNILKFGFIKSLADGSSTVPGSPRKRRRGTASAADLSHANEEDTSLVVGENAWPILDWLLVLFEKDESMTEASQQGSKYCHLFLVAIMPLTTPREARYSPLLLAQIPPTRSDAGTKWDANDPLEIVFHCFKQQDDARRAMGSRLLNLVCATGFSFYA